MARPNEHNSPRWGDKSPRLPDESKAELILGVTFPEQTVLPSRQPGALHAQTTTHGSGSHELHPRGAIAAPRHAGQAYRTGSSPAERLRAWKKVAGDTLRAAIVPIKNHLIKRYQKRWRTTNPIILTNMDDWKWSRACCRIKQSDETLVVSVGMHDHDISMVEAVVHNRVLAIRIQLGSGSTLQRAEPLPVAMQEAATIVSWDREEIRIELQPTATI